MKLTKEVTFEAAHQLAGPEWKHSKCSNIHGHTWKVQATVKGDMLKATNAVVDFALLGRAMDKCIFREYDHKFINDVLGCQDATSEFLAERIFEDLERELEQMGLDVVLESIRVRETESCWVEYSR